MLKATKLSRRGSPRFSAVDSKVEKVIIAQKFNLFDEYWKPRIVGAINHSYFRLVEVKGKFGWRTQRGTRAFPRIKGRLTSRTRALDVELQEGEFVVISRGLEHKRVADDEAYVMLLEKKTTINFWESSER